jgi:class 3 adenylate cyclase
VDQQIDLERLAHLTEEDFKRFGIPPYPRKQLQEAIAKLTLPRSKTYLEASRGSTASGLAQRRQLTVLFCDLVGSTALAVRLDPEDLREIIRAFIDTCANVVAKFDGHVAQILGDGVVVYFGYPKAREDAVERSALAGLSLIEAIRNLKTRPEVSLSVRIGIATGTVVVDENYRGIPGIDEKVTGPTPNLAARLQEIAKPNTVIVSDATKQLLGDLFNYSNCGPHHLKGIDAPVQVWQVISERHVESRFEAVRFGNRGAVIGRDAEVALLLSRWELVRQAEGQVVLLSGPPGIGKSRVASAFVDCISTKGEPHVLVRFQCSPTHTNTALYPVISHLEHAAEIAATEAPDSKLDKLAHLMTRTGGDPASFAAAGPRRQQGATVTRLLTSGRPLVRPPNWPRTYRQGDTPHFSAGHRSPIAISSLPSPRRRFIRRTRREKRDHAASAFRCLTTCASQRGAWSPRVSGRGSGASPRQVRRSASLRLLF